MSKTLWIGDVQDNWTEDYLFKLLQNASKLFVIIIIIDVQKEKEYYDRKVKEYTDKKQ